MDLVVLPQSLADAERGRLLAKLAVLGRVARLAEQEHAACVEQVNATMPELRDVVRALNLGESLGASGGTEPARRRALDDRRVALVEERAPLIRRGERAALVSGICRGLAERIDPTILLDQPHTWREGAGPAAERLARPQA